jgi:RimJ/RimL family protein N-acetyltransferase
MNQYKFFETKRLLIRPTSEQDAEFIFELVNTPKWIKNIGDRNINSVGMAKAYILKRMRSQLERLGYSNYTLIRKTDNVKIGTCGLYDREGLDGIDIGFAFLPEYEKKGFGFEAANKIKNVAFNEFGIKVISAITKKNNKPSQKLLKKLGLVLVGTTKIPDVDEEFLLYKIDFKNNAS